MQLTAVMRNLYSLFLGNGNLLNVSLIIKSLCHTWGWNTVPYLHLLKVHITGEDTSFLNWVMQLRLNIRTYLVNQRQRDSLKTYYIEPSCPWSLRLIPGLICWEHGASQKLFIMVRLIPALFNDQTINHDANLFQGMVYMLFFDEYKDCVKFSKSNTWQEICL